MKTEEVKKLAGDACAKLKAWQDAISEVRGLESSLETAQGRESERHAEYLKAAEALEAAIALTKEVRT